jgi:diacylglycerol kinase family enzyme
MSPEAILKATLDQPAIPIDTILVNDERYCVNVGCFGLDALIA